jgi:cystathionine gamma-synthase
MNRDDKVTNPVGSPLHDYGGNVSAATLSVWAGEHESLVQGATQVPVVYSAAYGYPDVDTWLDVALGRKPGHIYSRNTNPTVQVFEEKVRLLEGAEAATSFATGMAAIVVADNTFATPMNQKPLALGADLVVHSATKFLGGHADALGGVVCGNARLVQQIYHFREITGATLDPMAAYLIIRGMKTLHLRVRQQNESALRIARWLNTHPAVATVFYPGLETHVHHEVASRQMSGHGGVLSFMLRGGCEAVKRVLPRLRFAHRAANLGAVETIVGPPATTSHVECTPEEREAMGIPEGLIRYSVGIEDPNDLINDLSQALEAA